MIVTDPNQYQTGAIDVISQTIQKSALHIKRDDAEYLAEQIAAALVYSGFDCFRPDHPTERTAKPR